ncbi:hypothetical protein [Limihaloglobus sulfuriphilus]|nr:hypothetical protein [Limihaloglobus sulfuriphilus]
MTKFEAKAAICGFSARRNWYVSSEIGDYPILVLKVDSGCRTTMCMPAK